MTSDTATGHVVRRRAAALGLAAIGLILQLGPALANPEAWRQEWPRTDFTRHSVPFSEFFSGGPPKDGIPAIDDPVFIPISEVTKVGPLEPVISLSINGDFRAYPLQVLMWHEIVNDTVGGLPVAVTFCPLCNSAIVFDRRLGNRVLDFGTTGKLRRSDLVMYDRQSESWWQQFLGEAVVGELTGARLRMIPSRVESLSRFRTRAPNGKVLVPRDPKARDYGYNPYFRYDSAKVPGMYMGDLPKEIAPLERVVVVGNEAWSFALLRRKKSIARGDLVLFWMPGQNSALDSSVIALGRDVGNVTVQRRTADGARDVVYDVSFAFAFRAFHPDGIIYVK